jgi:predicted ester cyclase
MTAPTHDHVALARWWFEEVWNQRRTETVHELLRPDSVGHMQSGDVVGPEPFLEVHAELLKALPDLRIQVEDTLAQGDQVVVRWSASGTHRGKGMGCEPTGAQVRFRA